MAVLTTVGLAAAPDFPISPYELTHKIVQQRRAGHLFLPEFSGAWNALAYRFQAMTEASEQFTTSIKKDGPHPPPIPRYKQEASLSAFFNAGFAAFESAFYGLYAIGAMAANSPLTLATARERKNVSPSKVQTAFARVFANDPIAPALQMILNNPDFKTFRETRNTLTHRTAPGRTMYFGGGGDQELPTEWKLNKAPMDESITIGARAQVSNILRDLAEHSATFADRIL